MFYCPSYIITKSLQVTCLEDLLTEIQNNIHNYVFRCV